MFKASLVYKTWFQGSQGRNPVSKIKTKQKQNTLLKGWVLPFVRMGWVLLRNNIATAGVLSCLQSGHNVAVDGQSFLEMTITCFLSPRPYPFTQGLPVIP